MIQKIDSLFDAFWKVLAVIILVFQEIKMVLLGATILIVIDQISGVWKALKKGQFSWKSFSRVYAKLILYLFCIIACFVYEEMILETHAHYLTKGIGAVIGFQELSSIYLNVSVITGTNFLKEYLQKKFK